MIYPEMREVLGAALSALSVGAALGAVSPIIGSLLSVLQSLLCLPSVVRRCVASGEGISSVLSALRRAELSAPMRHAEDFLTVLCFGITEILLLYVLADGMIRAYLIILPMITFAVAQRFVGRYVGAAARRILLLPLFAPVLIVTILEKGKNVILCRWKNRHNALDKGENSC